MNISSLSALVSYAPGFLYKFTGDTAGIDNVSLHVTRLAATAANDNTIVTNVMILNKIGVIIYSQVEITHDDLLLIGSVEAEPVAEEVPTEEA